MDPVILKDNIYWVGAVDYNIRDFHGYHTPVGTSYNAYLIKEKELVLVDTVKKNFWPDFLRNIKQVADPAGIGHLIVNHVEMDHSGCVPEILNIAKKAVVHCTEKGREGLIKHYGINDREFNIVKTGDRLSVGGSTFVFMSAPMVHWPDSMFTYIEGRKVLLPNDAFGQHIAHPRRFADEIGEDDCLEEAAKYYANILMPLGQVISKKLAEFIKFGLPLEIIAPSHGAIWRRPPFRIVEAYLDWTAAKTAQKAVIIYDTMWGSTDIIARRLAEEISGAGVETKIYNVRNSDISQVIRDVLDARVLLFGSPTLNAEMFWSMGGFLTYLKGLKPAGKKAAMFGSYGWAEAASRQMQKEAESAGMEIITEPFVVKFVPSEEELRRLVEYAKVIVKSVKE